jgi:6-phosphofructokinase 1
MHFDPSKVNAAIVTAGGLCPGMNNVIREIVHTLHYQYQVKSVLGVIGGFAGFDEGRPVIHLTTENTENIHEQGGSFLPSARGGLNLDSIVKFIEKYQISQLFVIGGDGTHRGANLIASHLLSHGLNVAVTGIPKTIDNDIDLLDRSFGFQTAVAAAKEAIMSAYVEATCNVPNGIGLVKLMGRSAGFIASHASLASGVVDLCLVPEVPIILDGQGGCLPFLMERVKEAGHAVVVVAEGAGEDLIGKSSVVDAGGNRKLAPIGVMRIIFFNFTSKHRIHLLFATLGFHEK